MASVLSNYYIYFFSFLFLLIIIYQSIKIFKLNQRYKQLIDTIQQVENERNILLLEIRKVKLEILEKNQELESTYTALESSESLLNLSEKDLRQVQHSRDLLMEQINTLNSELSEFKRNSQLLELNNKELESTYTASQASESILNLPKSDLGPVQYSRDLLIEQINILHLELSELKRTNQLLESEVLKKNQELESTYTALESSESLLNLSEKDLRQVQHSRDLLMEQVNTLNSELSEFKQKQMSSPEELDPSVQIISDISLLQNQFKNLYEKWEKLENKYKKGRERYTSLLKELAILEERLDIYSFGLYEPHFNYDTPEKFKDDLDSCYAERKQMVKSDLAVTAHTKWTVNGSVVEGRKQTRHFTKIMLRAFNGECDAALLKVRWNNVQSMEERIRKSFDAINSLGKTHDIELNEEYLELRLKELWLTHEYQEKLYEEKEEQRRIREQIREEERSLKEMEVARKEAEKEEARYTKALEKARSELVEKHGLEKEELNAKIQKLDEKLREIIELKNRAISMAQITKAGYVYIISNIGSFGENIFKIGMTRRLEPSDRVRELSGASVPFPFDIHAMVYSENAPELENNLHKKFRYQRVNLVNGRKEFFNISLEEVASATQELNHDIQFTKLAEARDFRKTQALQQQLFSNKENDDPLAIVNQTFPDKLFDELDSENQIDDDELLESA